MELVAMMDRVVTLWEDDLRISVLGAIVLRVGVSIRATLRAQWE